MLTGTGVIVVVCVCACSWKLARTKDSKQLNIESAESKIPEASSGLLLNISADMGEKNIVGREIYAKAHFRCNEYVRFR